MEDNHSQRERGWADDDAKSIWDGGQPFPTLMAYDLGDAEVYLGWRTTIPNEGFLDCGLDRSLFGMEDNHSQPDQARRWA